MATSKGVALFNNDTISNRIFTNTGFHSIFIDKTDNKWFIGDDGVYFLNKSGSQHHLNQDFPNLPVSVYSIDEDPKTGDKFISTANGIYLFSSKLNQVSQLTKEECYSAFVDKNDSIWFSTRQGLLIAAIPEIKKNGMSGKFRNLNSTLNVQNEIINNISTNKYGSVWLVTDSRIIQAISTDQEAIQYEQKKGIKDNKIMSFLIDKEDNIWVGFSGGLQRLSKYEGLRNFYPNTINSFIYSFYADNSDRLWIASNNGVFYYEEELINFTPRLGSDNQKYVMGKLANGNILFANSKGLYEVDQHSLSIVQQSRFKEMIMSPEGVFISSKGEIVILTGFNGILYYLSGFTSDPLVIKNKWSSNVTRLIEKDGRIIGGSSNGLIELKNGSLKSLAEMDCQVYSVYNDNGILWLGTDFGLAYIKNSDFDNIQFVSVGNSTVVKSIFPAKNRNYLWLGTNQGISYFNKTYFESDYYIDSKDGLSADEITPAGLFLDRNGLLWIGTFHGISNFNMRAKSTISYTPECYIERTLLNGRKIDNTDGHTFRYNQNNLIFEISALTYKSKESIEYEFYLRGTGNDYSSYHKGKEFKAYYNNLPPGTYEFIYKAKGDNNIWGYAKKYEFNIKTAWYNTVVFRALLIIAIALLIWLFYKQRVKSIEAQKRKLEEIVRIRTNELQLANLEIEGQRDLATAQRDKIIEQKKEITDSIYYSERIQRSLLPESGALRKILPEHFILFKPRDIVSGDFYWVTEKANFTYVAAVDCTGHGVPGALMSMLGISFLNEIVNKSGDMYPEEILNQLRNYIIKALKQAGQIGEARDGMDASLIAYDKSNGLISFSGANNPLYLVRNGELEEIKGDKMPVGIHERMDSFTRHTFNVKSGDTIYLFSDGYADQFGGPKYKKFKYANFKTLLVSLQPFPMEAQCCKLQETMNEWKGDKEQIDDMIIVGLRF
ncbi:MAG: SpoIIE family protein phosphatase [Bacteroidales bacterium]|nr:SpoIIE family protein phosphatase [Bacteroidales bacterium]